MTTREEAHFLEPRVITLLWYGFLIGPAAWKLQLVVNYALVPFACWHDLSVLIHLASLATFLLALSGGWVSWGIWQRTGSTQETQLGGPLGRSRFIALSGMFFSGFFAIIILGQWVPNLLLSPCDGIS